MKRITTGQYAVLKELLRLGAAEKPVNWEDFSNRKTSTWVSLEEKGLIKVHRGTPDNRGGNVTTYRYTLTEDGLRALGKHRTSPALIEYADAMRTQYMAIAGNPDPEICAWNAKPYINARKDFQAAIRLAFPGIDTVSVYDVAIDSGEETTYCANWVMNNGKFRI